MAGKKKRASSSAISARKNKHAGKKDTIKKEKHAEKAPSDTGLGVGNAQGDEKAATEGDLVLTKEGGRKCWYKVLPWHAKYKNEGDKVRCILPVLLIPFQTLCPAL
ncbi:MAG: hypothetical protein ACHQWH_02250 [Nitrososphaerales archaeon]